jgi:hypothetical protein
MRGGIPETLLAVGGGGGRQRAAEAVGPVVRLEAAEGGVEQLGPKVKFTGLTQNPQVDPAV